MAAFEGATSGPSDREPEKDATTRLRQAIIDGRLGPNQRLVEIELAAQLATSRNAVRSALAILKEERLVVHEPNRGARVRAFTAEETGEILETRAVVEALVARKAAERIDDAGVDRLRVILAGMERSVAAGDLRAFLKSNADFHEAISAIAGHATSAHVLSLLKWQGVRNQNRSILHPGRVKESFEEHRRIFEALSGHDPARAEQAMLAHFAGVRIAIGTASMQIP
jgi:DNA-binding GntR family transcriptional regulator